MSQVVGSMIISLSMNITMNQLGGASVIAIFTNTTITWLRKHNHMARYFPIFLVFGAKFQYFDNGE